MKKISILTLLILTSASLFAGDIAEFVNLGFSPDGKYFMFAEHGIEPSVQKAYSNLWIVDVNRNRFVKEGKFSGSYNTVVEPGESSAGAMFKLLEKAVNKRKQYQIDYLEQGRPLYIRINEEENVDTLDFRDFISGKRYSVELKKNIEEDETSVKSSFVIHLETEDSNGKIRSYVVGLPDFKRKGVADYRIDRILHAPGSQKVVFVISKYIKDGEDISVRYMVESVPLL